MSLPVLNLLNFELPSANKCRYVLTSPRSLKACRKARIKPIELLYKSASEFERETGKREDALNLFQAYEKERQRKLTLCRSIRNQFLLYGYSLVKDPFHKPERINRYSPKLQDIKERGLPAIRECYLRKRAETPENMRNIKEHTGEQLERHTLNLPKVNVTFEHKFGNRFTENKPVEERKTLDKVCGSETKVENEYDAILLVHENINKLNKTDKKHQTLDEAKVENDTKEEPAKMNLKAETDPILEERQEVKEMTSEMNKSPENAEEVTYTVRFKEKRPNSAYRRKTKEPKRKSKVSDQKKLIHNLKIQYSDPQYSTYKYKQVIENSVDRELREIEVHRVQRELEEGMEKWQDRVLLLQWLDVNRARDQASRELEVKVERLQQKNRVKSIIHTMNFNKVKEAEDMKAEGLRRQVEEKDRKIHELNQEKERVIFESKSRALSIIELKDHIRSIMTPETFDQKVAKLGMHKRVLDSHMCARVMQRSHIWLG